MVPPVAVSPLIKTARWSALLVGVIYGKQRFGNVNVLDMTNLENEVRGRREKQKTLKQIRGHRRGWHHYDHLKPIAAEERRIEEEEKAAREERERIYKRLSEENSDSILK